MTPRRLLGRRHSTPVRSSGSSPSGQSLPSDLLLQTCRRIGIVSMVFASIWAFMTTMNTFVIPLLSERMDSLYPFPGTLIGAAGVGTSLLMARIARKRCDRQEWLIDMGSIYLVVQCVLISLLTHWI